MEKRLTTDALMKRLYRTKKLNHFIENYKDSMEEETLGAFLGRYLEEHALTMAGAIRQAQIERSYGYQIFRGIRLPSRDKVLQLAFGMRMNVEDTERMLRIAGKSPLYPRLKRDAVIVFCLKEGITLEETQEYLAKYGLSALGEIES